MRSNQSSWRGRAVLLASTGIFAASGVPAFAEDTGLQEVVVTARRIAEPLKDTPIAVTAFSADDLATQGAQNITDLTYMTPSTSLFAGRGSNSTLTAYIRGVGQQDPTWGSEPGVGIYVDDIYYARPQAAVLDIYDVSQIEVLRGPQGTLYGKNTIGGAIKYVTSDLSNKPTESAAVTIGSYGEHDFIGSFSAPIDDKWRIGAAIADYNHDGWGKDLTTGAQIDNRDMVAGRVSVEFLPTEYLTFKLNADDTVDMSNGNPGHREVPFAGYAVLSNKYDSYAGEDSRNFVTDRGVSLTSTWVIDPNWSVKSITAYRDGRTNTNIDFAGLPQPYFRVPARYYDHQTSEEVQATYTGTRLRGVAGLYYMDSLAGGEADFQLKNLIGIPFTEYLKGHILTNSWAGYADGSFDITDQLFLSAGGRYSNDAKSASVYQALYLGIPSPGFGGNEPAPFAVNTNYNNHKSWADFTPRVSLSYKITPEITSYVSYAEGFRSGGFDIRGNATIYPATKDGFRPETVDTYEVGVKGDYFARHLQLNLDGFYSKYQDQQITVVYPLITGPLNVVENAASSHIEGIEVEAIGKLSENLKATFVAAYTFAAFDQFNQVSFAGVGAQPAISGFQYTPKWTGSVELTHTLPFADGSVLTSSGNVAYRGFTQIYDTPSIIDQKSYTLLGANFIWTAPSGQWSLGLKGSNLTDARYRIGGYNFPLAGYGQAVDGFYGAPRTILGTLAVHF